MFDTDELIRFVQERLAAAADPSKAVPMAAYMKTDMPFYGVPKPMRVQILRQIKQSYRPDSWEDYASGVGALWALPHREEKYLAIDFAEMHRQFIVPESMPVYERLIREGAWWDFVDSVAAGLVGHVLLSHRAEFGTVMERWIDDDHLWIRRTAIIAQLRHKSETDPTQLFDFCLRRAHETEFFIRKAIGWALREYGKTAPQAVATFLRDNRDRLSGLSYREGARRLIKAGVEGL